MQSYLQPSTKPVVAGLEPLEIVMAAKHPEYNPLRCLPSNTRCGRRLSRWMLADEQRDAIANGADVFLELLTFNTPLQPMRVSVADELDIASVVEEYELQPVIDSQLEKQT